MATAISIGALGPLSAPGFSWAGRELRDGMELAVSRVNDGGGVLERPLGLVFADTMGTPTAGIAAVERLLSEGVDALVGEFHSVVAHAIAERIDSARLPFVCASATLDAITARRSPYIFRIAPAQSYGWRVYADFLVAQPFKHVVAVIQPDVYWSAGCAVLKERLQSSQVPLTRLAIDLSTPSQTVVEAVQSMVSEPPAPDIVLLLIGYPEPLGAIVRELQAQQLVPGVLALGDPAGRVADPAWWDVTGPEAVGASFLAYQLPDVLSADGRRVARGFEEQFGREPSFVALEGYDSVSVLARAIEAAGGDSAPEVVCSALRRLEVEATRGMLRFSTDPSGVIHQQWAWPPVSVAAYHHPRQRFSGVNVLWQA
jgi:ABC-type branched-subunit amino acid transport system substrate-binding protein